MKVVKASALLRVGDCCVEYEAQSTVYVCVTVFYFLTVLTQVGGRQSQGRERTKAGGSKYQEFLKFDFQFRAKIQFTVIVTCLFILFVHHECQKWELPEPNELSHY